VEVLEGSASVDESSFTGESVPATKRTELKLRVAKVGEQSYLSQLVRLMAQIAERKLSVELLADRLMNYYGPVVFIGADLSLIIGDWIASTLVLLTVVIMGNTGR
jgi:P-type Cu+ transporter